MQTAIKALFGNALERSLAKEVLFSWRAVKVVCNSESTLSSYIELVTARDSGLGVLFITQWRCIFRHFRNRSTLIVYACNLFIYNLLGKNYINLVGLVSALPKPQLLENCRTWSDFPEENHLAWSDFPRKNHLAWGRIQYNRLSLRFSCTQIG